MSYTTPRTWVANELVTAALLNTHLRDNLAAINAGAISVASQAAGDWLQASSASALARVQPYVPFLSVTTTAVGNVGSGEDTLMTYQLAEGLLGTAGWGVEIIAAFACANNSNTKTIKLYFGATAIATYSASTYTAMSLGIHAFVIRTGPTAQLAYATYGAPVTNGYYNTITTPAETLANAITIKATGEATSDNDISQKLLMVRLVHTPT